MNDSRFKKLPAISKLLEHEHMKRLSSEFGHGAVTWALRGVLEDERKSLAKDEKYEVSETEKIAFLVTERIMRAGSANGKHVINATGIVLHTGLGRAPLTPSASDALALIERYSLVELDLESGERGSRDSLISEILREITGSEESTVVNNNAAATFLILNALAFGKEVIVSRGQLIEIGGSFRLPNIMESGGTKIREVGTTNKTHVKDYADAISEKTGLIIHVHTSNYEISGFTSTPSLQELVALGKKHGIPVVDDLGSGALVDLKKFGLPESPTVQDSLKAGCDLVCYSGDKLIGGPQAGIISGKSELIRKLKESPFYRMFRIDKLCLATLETTLLDFMTPDTLRTKNSVYLLACRPLEQLRKQAEEIRSLLESIPGVQAEIVDSQAFLGGGSLPNQVIPSVALALSTPFTPQIALKKLRLEIPSVIARVSKERILFDMRTIFEDEIDLLSTACQDALQ